MRKHLYRAGTAVGLVLSSPAAFAAQEEDRFYAIGQVLFYGFSALMIIVFVALLLFPPPQ
jgi:hypothetical protein